METVGRCDMKHYEKKSSEERKEELSALMGQLEEGVKNVFTDENFVRYLRVSSQFRRYSLNNQILIWCQCPNATAVASFTDWKNKFHRFVKAGEKGIRILAPMPILVKNKEKKEDIAGCEVADMSSDSEDEKRIMLFKPVCVFDVSQTDGDPLPEIQVKELDGKVDGYDEIIEAICHCTNAIVSFEDTGSDSKGYFSPRKNCIVVQEGMSESQSIKTLLHEVAHSILHNADEMAENPKDRMTKEVEAEGTAFVVSAALGLDTSSYSFGYIGSWSSNKSVPELRGSLELIRSTAAGLIEDIEEARENVAGRSKEVATYGVA